MRQEAADSAAAQTTAAATAEELRARLEGSDAELTAMTLALEAERRKAEETLTLLAAAEAAKQALAGSSETALTEAQRRAAELAQANILLSEQKDISAEGQRQVALLNQQTASLRAQLNQLQGVLDAAGAKDAAAQVQIESLGQNLNAALARVAVEEKRRAELEAAERERLAAEAKDLGALPLGVLRADARHSRLARGGAGGRRPLRLPVGGAVRARLGDAGARGPGAGGAGGVGDPRDRRGHPAGDRLGAARRRPYRQHPGQRRRARSATTGS